MMVFGMGLCLALWAAITVMFLCVEVVLRWVGNVSHERLPDAVRKVPRPTPG